MYIFFWHFYYLIFFIQYILIIFLPLLQALPYPPSSLPIQLHILSPSKNPKTIKSTKPKKGKTPNHNHVTTTKHTKNMESLCTCASYWACQKKQFSCVVKMNEGKRRPLSVHSLLYIFCDPPNNTWKTVTWTLWKPGFTKR